MTFNLRKLLAPFLVDAGPLDHPELNRMTLRELDDLPLPRWTSDDRAPRLDEMELTLEKTCAVRSATAVGLTA